MASRIALFELGVIWVVEVILASELGEINVNWFKWTLFSLDELRLKEILPAASTQFATLKVMTMD